MKPQCQNSDSETIIISDDDDVIPISPQPLTEIDITESEEYPVLLNSETVKSQRKSLIDKIFPSQPSSSSSVPTAVNLKETTQNAREYTIAGVRVVFPVKPYGCQINVMSKVSSVWENFNIYVLEIFGCSLVYGNFIKFPYIIMEFAVILTLSIFLLMFVIYFCIFRLLFENTILY